MAFTLSTPAFEPDHRIDRDYTCDGVDSPPLLAWKDLPKDTRSLALIMDDPDAPSGLFTHWLVWNIPASEDGEPVQVGDLGVSGENDFHRVGYGGPCPPPKHGDHHYHFKLFALDVPSLDLAPGARRAELEKAIEGHVLDQTEVVGLYRRD